VLAQAAVIYLPRARSADLSIARQCLDGLMIPESRLREVEFTMDPDREVLSEHYSALAAGIALELEAGRDVAYLTLGDPMTYSTYGYTMAALRDISRHHQFCRRCGCHELAYRRRKRAGAHSALSR
jgi:precorrin-2/cobalt-factor-2 C20-methyltransferase